MLELALVESRCVSLDLEKVDPPRVVVDGDDVDLALAFPVPPVADLRVASGF